MHEHEDTTMDDEGGARNSGSRAAEEGDAQSTEGPDGVYNACTTLDIAVERGQNGWAPRPRSPPKAEGVELLARFCAPMMQEGDRRLQFVQGGALKKY